MAEPETGAESVELVTTQLLRDWALPRAFGD
mgnify:CR=1 FL=1